VKHRSVVDACSEIIKDSSSAVPVVKLNSERVNSEYITTFNYVTRDVTDRCVATDVTSVVKETAPDAHVVGN